ncbi:unnamed protein product [Lupinus luteus]|uniref:Chlorophyll a-b binding protein, chloroplastic n=1 Tax=Lupinus luteus TaxID=3873 RepID=A0AAV1Y7L4_LUPLU
MASVDLNELGSKATPVATERRVSFWQLINRPKEGLTLLPGFEEWEQLWNQRK